MDSRDQHHRRNSSTPQIPLQDLSPPQRNGSDEDSDSQSGTRARAISDLVRNRLSGSWSGRALGPSYTALGGRDPDGMRQPTGAHLSIPQEGQGNYGAEDVSPTSPVDGAAFGAATSGFAGLSFGSGDGPDAGPLGMSNWSQNDSSPSLRTVDLAETSREVDDYFTPSTSSNDRTPLADSRYLQPIAGVPTPSTPSGRSDDRSSRSRSVRFSTHLTPTQGSRLGDDLAIAELGTTSSDGTRTSGSIRRSLSPSAAGSTLHRAGTIVRNMSTRIVNLSNEADVVDRTLKRKTSVPSRGSEASDRSSASATGVDGPNDEEPYRRPEKTPSLEEIELPRRRSSTRDGNPLKGKSLGIFSPDNKLRMKLCDLLVHPVTEPLVFLLIVLQTIILAVDSNMRVEYNSTPPPWGQSWIDWFLLVLFSIYTVEIIIRSIVSGLIVNPVEYSTINRKVGLVKAVKDKFGNALGTPQTRPGQADTIQSTFGPHNPGILRSFTTNMTGTAIVDVKGSSKAHQRARLAHRAFLRHSFNRLDFLAVTAYWISFVLAIFHVEGSRHLYIFRMMSCLRILRLLFLTSGTTIILRSLKKAAGLLTNVAFLIGFFWLLFAVVGLQSFKSSLRRQCVWFDPSQPSNQTGNYTNNMQFCGGWLDQNLTAQPWMLLDDKGFWANGSTTPKGFICPQNSKCLEQGNPYNGTVSFDNIFQSLELVFVIMTSNTFSDLMYYLTNSDYLSAAIFFACGIVIIFFWLVNLLIAVITSSFAVIREEGRASAFTGHDSDAGSLAEREREEAAKPKISSLQHFFNMTKWFWIVLIAFDLVVQCLRSAEMGLDREHFIENTETIVTLLLLLEIILRFIVDWRHFFKSKRNIMDLALAVITSVIQLPPIKKSEQVYPWLTLFQILRTYRVVLAVPITRNLIMTVLGNFTGLLNLILFVFLLTFLAAILASQMFRGSLPPNDPSGDTINITFNGMWNSFLGMYQIFSSENWTTIMYNVTNYDVFYNTAWMGAAFFILWFILANFIVLNMFIAVIQENFDISEDEKRLQQVKAFLQQKDLGGNSTGNLSLSTIFKYSLISGRKRDPLSFGSATTEMLLKDAVVKDFLDQDEEGPGIMSPPPDSATGLPPATTTRVVDSGIMSSWWGSIVSRFRHREPNPFYSRLEFSRAYEDLDPRMMAKEVMSARDRRKRAQRDYLLKHPNYNVSLFVFRPTSRIRRICQRIVGPGRGGDRIEGVAPSVPVWYAFSAFIYCAIVAMVILACVTTPLYQKVYFQTHKFSVKNWFVYTDMGFAVLFTVEAFIKVIADGLFFTPNAYFRGSWGAIDGVVLITLWINVLTSLNNAGAVSRAVGAFKALRALRLLNVSDSARNNFHSVIVRGGLKVLSAAFVAIALLIPFAVYGLNLFVGKMQACNDTNPTWNSNYTSSIFNLQDCVGEYMTSSSPSNWNILAPRVVANTYYSFDDFGSSLFILFQIVSQEGWIDVMWRAISIVGVGQQPQPFNSYFNAVFFVVFNLLGAVFVLTLFVSVFMRNYTEQTGVAYLTTDQRSWLELRKLLRQISPSKRPLANKKRESWKEWCYRRAVRKTGKWQRFVTAILVIHLILLCVEFYPTKVWWDRGRDVIFFLFSLIYASNLAIRMIGLTWTRFRRSSWDLYASVAVSLAVVTSVIVIASPGNWFMARMHKFVLVSISLLLIPRNNQLDQLFKTAAASLPLILNLLATWFVLFLTFAIALTQTFGLTKFNTNESVNANFRTVPKALILLFRTSVGEGWNQIMEDFAEMRPPYCIMGDHFSEGDCGSPNWARFLFIAWNILSMYIFVNLFVSLIYESFSYVYQRSSGLSVISREEIRRFKQAWAEFDPQGTGYISKEAFPRLLGELSGVFEMRIYDGDFSVASLIEDCSVARRQSSLPVEGQSEPREIDIKKLNARLAELPIKEIQRRRNRMNKFYEEVLVSSDHDRGISFTSLLMILAHYKVINDNRSLRLHEFLRRRARLQRVEEAVRRNVVIGFFDTVYWSRQFKNHRQSKDASRMTMVPQFTVPEIFVDDEAAYDNNGMSPFDGPGFGLGPHSSAPSTAVSSPRMGAVTPPPGSEVDGPTRSTGGMLSRSSSIQQTPDPSPIRSRAPPLTIPHTPQGHERTGSDNSENWQFAAAMSPSSRSRPSSPLGVEPAEGSNAARSRANSNVSARDVLGVLEDSAWGESIRKSFSTRRSDPDPDGRGSGGLPRSSR
ncbi:calcium-channel protein CCH1 [Venturia nashicola]|uniref:Calcium-channel protein CCH1 n=1 Tax=Venturia nashicola TaxID=86259 RepID=A0A4Z1PI12_9PEZI|nr:calcium-channel protein CCH1 [Venturia nashicola]TLD34881.1 calcium-channel protein CCH1 [Venturia nashicola]